MHCLWDDIHELLDCVKKMWRHYKEGKMELATVAVTTNTAVDLVRRAEHEFVNGRLRQIATPKAA